MNKQILKSKERVFAQTLEDMAPAFGVSIDTKLTQVLCEHFLLLLKWNQTVPLTSIIDPIKAAQFHYLESLYVAQFFNSQYKCIVDIGSGAGFPGFPIAASMPLFSVVLVESNLRKALFLQTVKNTLHITNISVFQGQFQNFPCQNYDIVICRAIEQFSKILPQILTFADSAHQLFLLVGQQMLADLIGKVGSTWIKKTYPIPLSKQRWLISLSKNSST